MFIPARAIETNRMSVAQKSQPRPDARGWQRERLRIVRRGCSIIDGARPLRSVEQSCRVLAGRWKNKRYRTAPNRLVRLSAVTWHRLFWRWLRLGRSDAALELQYRRFRPVELTQAQRAQLFSVLCDSECGALMPALRGLFGLQSRPSDRTLLRIFSTRDRAALRQVFRARREHRRAERAFAKAIHGKVGA